MPGRDRFNSEELVWIREQLVQLRQADRGQQKRIRARLRQAGFHVSDWAAAGEGFTASEFDALRARGRIVRAENVSVLPAGPDPVDVGVPGGPVDTWVAAELPSAIAALTAPRHDVAELIATAHAGSEPGALLDSPGLYAIYGNAATWRQLALGDPQDHRPLYVGKAEQSLVARDLRTHFSTGKTGQSSPRRSFAALLAGHLPLVAMPRRPDNPEPTKWTHFALEADGDEQLTAWMLERLRLAAWPSRAPRPLAAMERAVMNHWRPPLNLTGVQQPWSRQVRAARGLLARAAQDWVARQA